MSAEGRDLIAHRASGEGSPVLLLNGGMMSQAAWEPVAVPLRRRHEVVTCDLRGQLMSPGEAHPEVEGNVGDVVAVLDELGLGRVHVIGTSFGAEVGLALAAEHPRRVRSLVAATATDRVTTAMRRGVEQLREVVADVLAGGDRGRFYDEMAAEVYSTAWLAAHRDEQAARRAQVARLPDAWFRGLEGILAATERLDLTRLLGRVRCPTLVIVAGEDRVMEAERSRALAAAIPGGELLEVPGRGHALVAEDPALLAAACLGFLERVEKEVERRAV
jgi:pimeloyl-ACP methyl ester carboxylesterase